MFLQGITIETGEQEDEGGILLAVSSDVTVVECLFQFSCAKSSGAVMGVNTVGHFQRSEIRNNTAGKHS